jgi:hypothetical protein
MPPYSRFHHLGHLQILSLCSQNPPIYSDGMLITVLNQYPVQRWIPLESVRWEVSSHQLAIEIFNSWSVSP